MRLQRLALYYIKPAYQVSSLASLHEVTRYAISSSETLTLPLWEVFNRIQPVQANLCSLQVRVGRMVCGSEERTRCF